MNTEALSNQLQEIAARIVEIAKPVQILVFGSAARGDFGRDSDADILVIVRPPVQRRELVRSIRRELRDITVPLDIVVVTTEDVELYRDSPAFVIQPALREGQVLYGG